MPNLNNANIDVLIIGAGLTGLYIGYLLQKTSMNFQIIEARNRCGGRILTINEYDQAPIEMGATWLGKKHKALTELMEELGLEVFEQVLGKTAVYEPISTSPHQVVQLPPNDDPSFRIKGGTQQLINKLKASIDRDQLLLNEAAHSIQIDEEDVLVQTTKSQYRCNRVVSTLPPYLLLKSIDISPKLPNQLSSIMQSTHTWMGESIKVALSFKEPFWRSKNLSGTLFSNVGPIPEMYDHSNFEDSRYALKGFLNSNYFSYSKEERQALILKQLEKYYGPEIRSFVSYEETVWRQEPYTFAPYESHILPHQNNGHPIFRSSLFDGKLFVGGAETAVMHPGYMDGAISSAIHIENELIKLV